MTNKLKFARCVVLSLLWAFALCSAVSVQGVSAQTQSPSFQFMEATIPELQAALATGMVTSRDLVTMYLARIEAYDQRGPSLNAISVTNPKALALAGRSAAP